MFDRELIVLQPKAADAGRYTLAASNRDANETVEIILVVQGG